MTHLAEAPAPYRPAKLDRAAVLALMEAGVFTERKVEMMNGELIEMSPARDPDGSAIYAIAATLGLHPAPGLKGVSDGALFVDEANMISPDIAILPRTVAIEEAEGSGLALAIEVSASTLSYDLGRKAALYAAAGVPEYWVVDLENRKLHRHLDPQPDGYTDIAALHWTETLRPHLIPGCEITLSEVLDR